MTADLVIQGLAQLPRFPKRSAEISRGCVGIE
jgi:hypothetical protein